MPLSVQEFADKEDHELFVAIKVKDWERAESLIEAEPHLIQAEDRFGNTPLHSALGFQAPEHLSLKLLETFPNAAKVHGTEDWLPLHVASMWGAPSNVVEALIRAYPEALDDDASGDIKGRTPRHFAERFPHLTPLLMRPTNEWQAMITQESSTA